MPSSITSRTWSIAPASCGGIFDFDTKRDRLTEVVKLSEDPGVWADNQRAQELGRERKTLDFLIERASIHP